jgi:ActR/RegA family two-component response regulator
MFERIGDPLRTRVLIIDDEIGEATTDGRAIRGIAEALRAQRVDVIEARSADDGLAAAQADAGLHAIILDWRLRDDTATNAGAIRILEAVRARDTAIPIFLTADRDEASTVPLAVMRLADEFVWTLEDTGGFIAGRVLAAVRRYEAQILPPMAAALFKFARTHEYSWHTPGHAGGTAFLKAPAGRLFAEHFGEALLRSDLSISVAELGSLLDHTGAIGVLRYQWVVHRQSNHLHGVPHGGRPGAVRSQLSQVDRPRSDADRRRADLPAADSQPLRHHRSYPSIAAHT